MVHQQSLTMWKLISSNICNPPYYTSPTNLISIQYFHFSLIHSRNIFLTVTNPSYPVSLIRCYTFTSSYTYDVAAHLRSYFIHFFSPSSLISFISNLFRLDLTCPFSIPHYSNLYPHYECIFEK